MWSTWHSKDIFWLYIAVGFWAIGPPVWFWYEYFRIYRKYGLPDTLELFKHGQDVAKAIWAGVLAGLIAFAASDAVQSNNKTTSSKKIDCTRSVHEATALEK